jgi:hypothetical protein
VARKGPNQPYGGGWQVVIGDAVTDVPNDRDAGETSSYPAIECSLEGVGVYEVRLQAP